MTLKERSIRVALFFYLAWETFEFGSGETHVYIIIQSYPSSFRSFTNLRFRIFTLYYLYTT